MSTQIVTPEAIISFPKLFTPDSFGDGDPKYSAALIFEEGTDISSLEEAVLEVAVGEYGSKAKAMIKNGQLRTPFRTDVEAKGYPDGSIFFNARSARKPGVVSLVPDENGKPTIITDEDAVIAGARVKAALSVFHYNFNGTKGISFGLNHIQLLRGPTEEERMDGRVRAVDTFDADASAAADLSDMETDDEDNLDDLAN